MAASCRAAQGCDEVDSMPGNYEVITIGSRAGRSTLAQQLAPTGKRILILERGDWLKREASTWDAKAGCLRRQRYVSPDTWYDRNGKGLPARKSTTLSVVPQKCTALRSVA